ncbi:MAG: FGGY family carbohydrate kinase, partial [Verrucomicrobiota bacterium]
MIFLGIDSGTQSTKCIALDAESGSIVAEAQEAYDLIPGLPEGHLEQDPKAWIDACEKTMSSCLSQLGERKAEVRGIGVSGQQHGLVVLDENKNVIRPAKLWCDTSTVEQCAQFEDAFGGVSGLIEKCGNAMLPGYTAPKIAWLKQNEPENFAATKHVLLPHDYINFWLTGELRMEYGDASGTGLMDVRKRTWCEELIDFIDPSVA